MNPRNSYRLVIEMSVLNWAGRVKISGFFRRTINIDLYVNLNAGSGAHKPIKETYIRPSGNTERFVQADIQIKVEQAFGQSLQAEHLTQEYQRTILSDITKQWQLAADFYPFRA